MSIEQSIQDLTNQIRQLGESGAADLQLSESARQKYRDLIKTYRDALYDQRQKAAGLANYGNVGNWPSANQTKWHLQSDVNDGVLPALDKYISYLDEFEKTVNAAFNRMQAEDKGS